MTTASYDSSTAWSNKELSALEDIKQAVIESYSLHYRDDSKVLVIETDASDYGADKVIESIAFMGCKFTNQL